MTLSVPMRDLLWTIAQHKYGWAYVARYHGIPQVAEALERRGLVTIDRAGSDSVIAVTDAGMDEMRRRWPVSPCVLCTYAHQPGGWTPREGVSA